MKKLILSLATVMLIIGCKNTPKKEGSEPIPNQTEINESLNEKETADEHTSQNSIDWEGSYFDTIPCASCPGIKVFITLTKDNKFEKVSEYLESEDGVITETGTFSWSEDGSKITLDDENKTIYKIAENSIFLLDKDGKEITGELADKYILQKTDIKNCSDFVDGYNLEKYKTEDGKEYTIVYNTNKKTPTALIESTNLKEELTQTTAWAKGAEYVKGDYKIIAKGDNVEFFIKDKKIILNKL